MKYHMTSLSLGTASHTPQRLSRIIPHKPAAKAERITLTVSVILHMRMNDVVTVHILSKAITCHNMMVSPAMPNMAWFDTTLTSKAGMMG